MAFKLEIPIQISLDEYLRNLPGTKVGPIEVKELPGLPPGTWFLVDLSEEE